MTVEEMERGIIILQRRIKELNALAPDAASRNDVTTVQRAIEESLDRIFGRDTNDYDRFISAAHLDKRPLNLGAIVVRGDAIRSDGSRMLDTRRAWAEGKASALSTLEAAIRMLEERIEYADPADTAAAPPTEPPRERSGSGKQIYNIHGPANIVGNATHSHVVFNVVQGDFASLKQALSQKGVSEADIQELQSAVKAEPTLPAGGKHGPRVATWIGKMVTKAAQGAWDISVGAAGALLAQLIGSYYGLE
jgi:hypothetical protein